MHKPSTTPQHVPIVGVFRSQAQADDAISALKDASFAGEQISSTEYQGACADENRIIVHVATTNRVQEAVDLLVHHGANFTLPWFTLRLRGQFLHPFGR